MAIDEQRIREAIGEERLVPFHTRREASSVADSHRTHYVAGVMTGGTGLPGYNAADIEAAGFVTPAMRNGLGRSGEDVGVVAITYLDARRLDVEDVRDNNVPPLGTGNIFAVAQADIGQLVTRSQELFDEAHEAAQDEARRGTGRLARIFGRDQVDQQVLDALEESAVQRARGEYLVPLDIQTMRREASTTGFALQRMVETYGATNPQVAGLDASSLTELFDGAMPDTLKASLKLTKYHRGTPQDSAIEITGLTGMLRGVMEASQLGWQDRNLSKFTSFMEGYTVQSIANQEAAVRDRFSIEQMDAALGGQFGELMPEKKRAQAYAKHKMNPLVAWAINGMVERGEI